MKKTRLPILVSGIVTLGLTLVACGGADGGTSGADAKTNGTAVSGSTSENGAIWYSTKNSTEQVHVAMAQGCTDSAPGLNFTSEITVAEADAAKQNEQMNNIIDNMSPAAIVLNPYDSDSVADVITKANNADIPLAVIDNKANNANVDVSVLFESKDAGKLAAERIVEGLKEKYGEPKGVVVNLYGEVVSQVFKERAEGFDAVIKEYPNIELISVLGAPETDVATSALNNIIADAKASGKTIDAVNTPADTAGLGAIEALKTNDLWAPQGKDNHVIMVSQDGISEMLDYLADGYLNGEIVADIMGVCGIAQELLVEYPMNGKTVPTEGTYTPKGTYLSTEVTFTKGDTGPTVWLDPIILSADDVDNPLLWVNAIK